MPNPYFSFKQFTVYHDQCAMKVGIDGVLLGAWAEVGSAKRILDIGAGTGLIALMLAQRSDSDVVAIDIDNHAVLQARENVLNSPWPDRIEVHETSLQNFAASPSLLFDLIVSNPPYFVNSLKTPSKSRTAARHADMLTHEELIENAIKLLRPQGRLCIILPVNEGMQCVKYAQARGLYYSKQVMVYPKPDVAAKRVLLEFSLQKTDTVISELTIENGERNHYSSEFSELAKDFYLKL